jgi:hypothetical protein
VAVDEASDERSLSAGKMGFVQDSRACVRSLSCGPAKDLMRWVKQAGAWLAAARPRPLEHEHLYKRKETFAIGQRGSV